jgi:hypothetical protein
MLCLAQPHGALKQPRSKPARASSPAPKPQSFTILERVPMRLPAHKPIWDALRKHAAQHAIVDDAHPEEAFAADIVAFDRLSADAIASISAVLAERRAMALDAEKDPPGSDLLAKRLDRIFEQEMEWLAIRNLLAMAARGGGKGGKRKASKALLLIDV